MAGKKLELQETERLVLGGNLPAPAISRSITNFGMTINSCGSLNGHAVCMAWPQS